MREEMPTMGGRAKWVAWDGIAKKAPSSYSFYAEAVAGSTRFG